MQKVEGSSPSSSTIENKYTSKGGGNQVHLTYSRVEYLIPSDRLDGMRSMRILVVA